MAETIVDSVTSRIARLDWEDLERQLDERGFAITEPVLSAPECAELPTCSTATGSGRRSTWPATASAMAAITTSPTRCRSRSRLRGSRSTRGSRRVANR
jgi:hypothetical protein